ncbi:tyrosine--tRNA ligase [candidate division KSB1 bacterium]|nr:tyrosine--tRNA ligase [candidate division KSB1 bacterium]
MDLIRLGAEEIISEEELARKLERSLKSAKPLIIKEGFDPTAPDLHIGHAVQLRKLKHFQDLGHQVVFLIGDFTGRVGDPTGRSKTRPPMTAEDVERNAVTYREQVFKILDPLKTQVRFNSEWLGTLTPYDLISLTSHYTVARMLERDDFTKRFKANQPISILEFMYPLLQGYDSVALRSDVELGGTDQKFNLLLGRTLQEHYGIEPQVCLMMPLLPGTDGVEKMSKSLNNYIGINETPQNIYGKTLSIPDNMIIAYYTLASGLLPREIREIQVGMESGRVNPRDPKRRLARRLVELYHSTTAAMTAEEEFDRLFVKKDIPDEISDFTVAADDDLLLAKLIVDSGGAKTNSEAKRLIEAGGVQLDQHKVSDPLQKIQLTSPVILKVGKRFFVRLIPKA